MPPVDPPVAGVRLADGRLVFVEGVPPDLPAGAVVRLRLEDREVSGVVSIPPSLLVWRDADAQCAAFLAVERLPEQPAPISVAPPLALMLADEGAPDEQVLGAMLALARAELGRLDD